MKLYVRADADSEIGTGHIMRCIALAQAWQDQGNEVIFISHCESDALRERIQIEGFRFISLDHVCPDSSDLMNTLSILKNKSADQKPWLVLDGYHFTPAYQKAIRAEGIRLLVIDDMNHQPHYHADILLNQNIHAPDLKYKCDADTTLLLGTRYVLLRREFPKYQDFKRQIPERAKNILVTLGGTDQDNVTGKVIEALRGLDIKAKIVVGGSNPHVEGLRVETGNMKNNELIVDATNMPELMAWADVAVAGGGTTAWEIAFMGLPSLVVVLAENQAASAQRLDEVGAMVCLGHTGPSLPENLGAALARLLDSPSIRRSLSGRARELVDGWGTERVTAVMRSKDLQ